MCLYPPLTHKTEIMPNLSRSGVSHDPIGMIQSDDPYFGRTQATMAGYWTGMESDLASRGTDWAALVAANPYKNISRKQTIWDKIANAFGMRSGYDKFLEQQQMNSQEYISNLTQKAYAEDYESPSAEAQRMRDAGLNPDLLGTEGVNGSSPMPEETGIDPSAFATTTMGDVVSFVGSAVSMAFGIAKDFQAMRSAKETIRSQKTENAKNMQALAIDAMLNHIGADRIHYDREKGVWVDNLDDYDPTEDSSAIAHNLGFSGRQAKEFSKIYQLAFRSLEGEDAIYGMLDNKNRNKLSYYRSAVSNYYRDSPRYEGEISGTDAMAKVNKTLQEMYDEITEVTAEAGTHEAYAKRAEETNNQIMQETKLEEGYGESQGEYLSDQSENNAIQERVNKIINKHMDDLIRNLEKSYQEDPDPWTEALIYAFSIHRLLKVTGTSDTASKAGNLAVKGIEALL